MNRVTASAFRWSLMWDTRGAIASTGWQSNFVAGFGRPRRWGVGMKTGAAAGTGRQAAAAIHETNDHMTGTASMTNHGVCTSLGTTRRTKGRQDPDSTSNDSKIRNEEATSHLAWNPDSRWSR